MAHVDEEAFASACAHADVDKEILRSLIGTVNGRYAHLKTIQDNSSIDFRSLWTTALRDDDRVNLLSFEIYKGALAEYYANRNRAKKKSSYKMTVEEKSSHEARIRISDGISLIFRSMREEGKLLPRNVTYRCHVLHVTGAKYTKEDREKAQKLAARAMNSLRKPTKRRRAA